MGSIGGGRAENLAGFHAPLENLGLRKSIRKRVHTLRRQMAAPSNLETSKFNWLLDRPLSGAVTGSFSTGESAEDGALVRRVMAAYASAVNQHVSSDSFWDGSIFNLNNDIHEALIGADEARAAELLQNPQNTAHFWGFDMPAKAPAGQVEPHQSLLEHLDHGASWQDLLAVWTYDKLRTLAEAVGAVNLHYPESPKAPQHYGTDELLDMIEGRIGTKLVFPNPFAGEYGLGSSRGIVSFRALQSLYQAWRIRELTSGSNGKVLEIGAGLGRTAFFAHQLGVPDYTIIDIPMTAAAQGYFLGRTLGKETVSLNAEKGNAPVKVVAASTLDTLPHDFDLIVNVDSLTEMAADTMGAYWQFIQQATPLFLSINHNANERSVSDLYDHNAKPRVTRSPYWMRRGYVEEIIEIAR